MLSNDYIQAVTRPFAAGFEGEFLDKLAEEGVDISKINEWYGVTLGR